MKKETGNGEWQQRVERRSIDDAGPFVNVADKLFVAFSAVKKASRLVDDFGFVFHGLL